MAVNEDAQRRQASRERSVDHLQGLYGVVVAIALGLAVDRIIPPAGHPIQYRHLLLGVALLVTLIPFYHGALRHLDEQYAQGRTPDRAGSVLVDFFVLFLEGCAFLALAVSVARPHVFAKAFLLLLALDIVWALLTNFILTKDGKLRAQMSWLYINVVTVAVLLIFLSTDHDTTRVLWYAILTVAVVRSAVDFMLTWRFYAAAPRHDHV
jgi:hypothetical protein